MLRNFAAFQNSEKSLKAAYNYTDREADSIISHCEGDILATQSLAKIKLQQICSVTLQPVCKIQKYLLGEIIPMRAKLSEMSHRLIIRQRKPAIMLCYL